MAQAGTTPCSNLHGRGDNFHVKANTPSDTRIKALTVDRTTDWVVMLQPPPDEVLHIGGTNPGLRHHEEAGGYFDLMNA